MSDAPQDGAEDAAAEELAAMLPVLSVLAELGNHPMALDPDPDQGDVELAEQIPDAIERLRPVQVLALGHLLQGKTKAEAAALVGVKRNSVSRWCNLDETFMAAFGEALADVRASTVPLLIDGFRQGIIKLRDLCETGEEKIALGAATQLTKLYRPEPIAATIASAIEIDTDAEWMRVNTQKGQAFLPHDLQLQAINCLARYLVLVAGVQSGKTTSGARNFWNRIMRENDPSAVYWLIAPTTGIGKVMRRNFVQCAPPGWLPNPQGSGAAFERAWTLKNGATVEFHSAHKATNLVAETLRGAWLDEFTLMVASVWHVSLRGRFATTGGWAIFTGTPRGPNWGYEDIWRRTQSSDDLYDPDGDWVGFTWHSAANPLVSADEVANAKATLPDAFYRREWEASWEAFHGQVFGHFTKATCVFDLTKVLQRKLEGDLIDGGVDWGYGKPGALVVGRYNGDDTWDVVHEKHEPKRLTGWWIERFKEAHLSFGIHTFWCDGAEPDRIMEARRALRKWARELDIPVPRVRSAKAAKKRRWPGIRHVASLFKQGRVRVHRDCSVFVAQHLGYKFKENRQGDDLDEIEQGNDHTCDAFRYMTYSRFRSGRREGTVVHGSA